MPRKSRVADVLARNEKGALAMEQNCPLKCVYHIDNPSGIGGEWSLSHSVDPQWLWSSRGAPWPEAGLLLGLPFPVSAKK